MAFPIRELESVAKLYNNRRIIEKTDKLKKQIWDFNCWCFTSLVLGWANKIEWFSQAKMEKFLESKCIKINKEDARKGDIVAYLDFAGLAHTAILFNQKTEKILHKNGSCPITTDTLYEIYVDCEVKFFRPKQKLT